MSPITSRSDTSDIVYDNEPEESEESEGRESSCKIMKSCSMGTIIS